MIITPTALDSTFKGFKTTFNDALKAAPSNAGQLAQSETSTGRATVYASMAQIPRMREWLGERVFNTLSSRTHELTNRTFELSLEVPREHIEDDMLGIYRPHLEMMGRQAGRLSTDLIIEALEAGGTLATGGTTDGVAFFSASHPLDPDIAGSAVQSNTNALAFDETNFNAVRTAMRKLKGADSRPLGINPRTLFVAPALETAALKVVAAQQNASGATNVYAGLATVVVLDELTSDTAWYLADLSMPFKPLVAQTRRAPEFVRQDQPGSDPVFLRNKFVYGCSARAAAGYGLWQLITRGNV